MTDEEVLCLFYRLYLFQNGTFSFFDLLHTQEIA